MGQGHPANTFFTIPSVGHLHRSCSCNASFKKLSDVSVPGADVPQNEVFHIRLAGQPRRFFRRAVVGVLGPCRVTFRKGAIVVQHIGPFCQLFDGLARPGV